MSIGAQIGDLVTKAQTIASLSRTLREALESGGNAANDYTGAAHILSGCMYELADEIEALYNAAEQA